MSDEIDEYINKNLLNVTLDYSTTRDVLIELNARIEKLKKDLFGLSNAREFEEMKDMLIKLTQRVDDSDRKVDVIASCNSTALDTMQKQFDNFFENTAKSIDNKLAEVRELNAALLDTTIQDALEKFRTTADGTLVTQEQLNVLMYRVEALDEKLQKFMDEKKNSQEQSAKVEELEKKLNEMIQKQEDNSKIIQKLKEDNDLFLSQERFAPAEETSDGVEIDQPEANEGESTTPHSQTNSAKNSRPASQRLSARGGRAALDEIESRLHDNDVKHAEYDKILSSLDIDKLKDDIKQSISEELLPTLMEANKEMSQSDSFANSPIPSGAQSPLIERISSARDTGRINRIQDELAVVNKRLDDHDQILEDIQNGGEDYYGGGVATRKPGVDYFDIGIQTDDDASVQVSQTTDLGINPASSRLGSLENSLPNTSSQASINAEVSSNYSSRQNSTPELIRPGSANSIGPLDRARISLVSPQISPRSRKIVSLNDARNEVIKNKLSISSARGDLAPMSNRTPNGSSRAPGESNKTPTSSRTPIGSSRSRMSARGSQTYEELLGRISALEERIEDLTLRITEAERALSAYRKSKRGGPGGDVVEQLQAELQRQDEMMKLIENATRRCAPVEDVAKAVTGVRSMVADAQKQIDDLNSTLDELVTREQMEEMILALHKAIVDGDTSAGATRGYRCLLCGKPTNSVIGMITDAEVAKLIGEPQSCTPSRVAGTDTYVLGYGGHTRASSAMNKSRNAAKKGV